MTVHKMDPKIVKKDGSNSLHIAAGNGEFGLVKYFTKDCQMDPQTVNEDGWNTLHCASQKGSLEIVQYLMTVHKMDPKIVKKNGSNSLHIAASSGQFGLVKYFTKGCQMDPQTVNEDGWNTLHYASQNGSLEIVQYLMTVHRIDPKTVTKNGSNSLHIAAGNGQFGLVKYFAKNCQMDPQTVNENGWNTLHCASQMGSLEIVQYLMTVHRMDPKTVTKEGSNSLHIAAANGQFGLVKYFTKGCHMDPQTVNEFGESAIMLAQINHHHHIEEYLMSLPNEDESTTSKEDEKEDDEEVEEKGKEVISTENTRWFNEYENAVKKRGYVIVNIVRCLVTGSSAVGKSSLKYLLAYDKSKEVNQSTALLERPEVVTVTSEKYQVDESIWKPISDTELGEAVRKAIQENEYDEKISLPTVRIDRTIPPSSGTTSHIEVDQSTFVSTSLTQDDVQSSPANNSEYRQPRSIEETTSNTAQKRASNETFLSKSVPPKDSISSLAQEYKQFCQNTNVGELKLKEQTFIHLLDTGGQAVFQDALPFLLNLPATYINVFNASKDLSEPVEDTYRPDSETCQTVPCSMTGLDMMQHLLSSAFTMSFKKANLPQGVKQPDFQIFLVGTFRDEIMKLDHPKVIFDGVKNHLKILSSKPYFKNIIKADKGIPFFVNNLMYLPNCGGCSSEEKQLVNQLRSLISSKKGLQLEMPVAWFMLNAFTTLIHKKFFQFEDFKKFCLQCDCIEKEQQDEQYEALLSLFHSLGLFFYLADIPPEKNWICTDATVLYKELAKILAIEFFPDPQSEATANLQSRGIISCEDCSDLFEEIKIDRDIPSEWFLQVLYSLNLSAKVMSKPDDYFIPLVLPNGDPPKFDCCIVENLCFAYNYKDQQKHFSKDLLDIPRGIFCKLAVQLAGRDMYKVCPEQSNKYTIKYLRKNMEVYLLEKPGRIEVAVVCSKCHCLGKDASADIKWLHGECMAIKKDLEEGINMACKAALGKGFLEAVNLLYGFVCNCSRDYTHLALFQKMSFYCMQSEHPQKMYPQRQIWLTSVEECSLQMVSGYWMVQSVYSSKEQSSIDNTQEISTIKRSTPPSTTSTPLQDAIQSVYTVLVNQLCTKDIREDLFAKGIIDMPLKQTIQNKNNSKEANEVLVDHLYTSGTVESVKRFIQVLRDTSSSYEVHEEIAQTLEGALRVHKVTV